jgi:bifunctional DNA-binding transcriptional regulator/antitoxin component of YhaV-PrlF toxin-antitoxin module
MPDTKNEIRLGAHGRVVIRSRLRKALDLKPGDRLVARQGRDSIVLARRGTFLKRLRSRFAHIPEDISLADELMAERQAEAVGKPWLEMRRLARKSHRDVGFWGDRAKQVG